MRILDLQDRLQSRVLVGDGAMGTLLYARGVDAARCFEELNLARPEMILDVHRAYVDAGACLLETNSFRANRLALAKNGLGDHVAAINIASARLARQAAGGGVLVAGSVGPLPQPGPGQDLLPQSQLEEMFREQMTALAEGGVDCFLLETFASIEELSMPVALARELGIPAIAQLAFAGGGRTANGASARDAVAAFEGSGLLALGCNCGGGPREALAAVREFAGATDLPISVFPNSGFPEYVDGRFIYLAAPEYFAARAVEMVEAGANLIGGCCGTTPDHIRALAAAVKGRSPVARVKAVEAKPSMVSEPVKTGGHFLENWQRKTKIIVELDPPAGIDSSKIMQAAKRLAAAGVEAISLAENPLARIRMSNVALAAAIRKETGVEVIVHMTGRDRNLIGLHSELLGAHLTGLHNVLAVTGDPVSLGGEAGASNVFDLNSIGILKLISSLNSGKTLMGNDIQGATRFVAGAAFNPNADRPDGQVHKLRKKVEAGAVFVQTQPVYDAEKASLVASVQEELGLPMFLGIMPLVSQRNAEFLHNEVPGISLSDDALRRMTGKSGEAGCAEGILIAREIIDSYSGNCFYLIPPFGKVDLALELINVIRNRRS